MGAAVTPRPRSPALFQVLRSKADEIGPVGGRCVSIGMLAEADGAVGQERLDFWKGRRLQAFLAIDFPGWTGGGDCLEHAMRILPVVARNGAGRGGDIGTATEKDWARRRQGDELVTIYRQLVDGVAGSGIFEEITRHPMEFVGSCDILRQFAIVAAIEVGAPRARR